MKIQDAIAKLKQVAQINIKSKRQDNEAAKLLSDLEKVGNKDGDISREQQKILFAAQLKQRATSDEKLALVNEIATHEMITKKTTTKFSDLLSEMLKDGDTKCIEFLLKAPYAKFAEWENYPTIFHAFVAEGSVEHVKLLKRYYKADKGDAKQDAPPFQAAGIAQAALKNSKDSAAMVAYLAKEEGVLFESEFQKVILGNDTALIDQYIKKGIITIDQAFQLAWKVSNAPIVKHLLESKADATQLKAEFPKVISGQDTKLVDLYLQSGMVDINEALRLACRDLNTPMVEHLLTKNPDINQCDPITGDNVLHCVMQGFLADFTQPIQIILALGLVEILVKRNPTLSKVVNKRQQTPAMVVLRQMGVVPTIHILESEKHAKLYHLLGYDLSEALEKAVLYNNPKMVRYLIEELRVDVNKTDALHAAVSNQDVAMTSYLLSAGAAVTEIVENLGKEKVKKVKAKNGENVLHTLVRVGASCSAQDENASKNLVKLFELINRKREPALFTDDSSGYTPFAQAIAFGTNPVLFQAFLMTKPVFYPKAAVVNKNPADEKTEMDASNMQVDSFNLIGLLQAIKYDPKLTTPTEYYNHVVLHASLLLHLQRWVPQDELRDLDIVAIKNHLHSYLISHLGNAACVKMAGDFNRDVCRLLHDLACGNLARHVKNQDFIHLLNTTLDKLEKAETQNEITKLRQLVEQKREDTVGAASRAIVKLVISPQDFTVVINALADRKLQVELKSGPVSFKKDEQEVISHCVRIYKAQKAEKDYYSGIFNLLEMELKLEQNTNSAESEKAAVINAAIQKLQFGKWDFKFVINELNANKRQITLASGIVLQFEKAEQELICECVKRYAEQAVPQVELIQLLLNESANAAIDAQNKVFEAELKYSDCVGATNIEFYQKARLLVVASYLDAIIKGNSTFATNCIDEKSLENSYQDRARRLAFTNTMLATLVSQVSSSAEPLAQGMLKLLKQMFAANIDVGVLLNVIQLFEHDTAANIHSTLGQLMGPKLPQSMYPLLPFAIIPMGFSDYTHLERELGQRRHNFKLDDTRAKVLNEKVISNALKFEKAVKGVLIAHENPPKATKQNPLENLWTTCLLSAREHPTAAMRGMFFLHELMTNKNEVECINIALAFLEKDCEEAGPSRGIFRAILCDLLFIPRDTRFRIIRSDIEKAFRCSQPAVLANFNQFVESFRRNNVTTEYTTSFQLARRELNKKGLLATFFGSSTPATTTVSHTAGSIQNSGRK